MKLHEQLAELDLKSQAAPAPATAQVPSDLGPYVSSAPLLPHLFTSAVAPVVTTEKLLLEDSQLPGCVGSFN